MRPSWSSMLALIMAATAVAQTCVAAAADAAETGSTLLRSNADMLDAATALLAPLGERSAEAWQQFHHWVGQSYERAPALMLGLSLLLAVPPLAIAGLLARGA